MSTIGQLWHPIWLLWWTVIGVPIHAVLKALLAFLNGNPIADAIGPFGVGGEVRWQGGSATLPADQDFAGSKINLGGMSYLFVINVRF